MGVKLIRHRLTISERTGSPVLDCKVTKGNNTIYHDLGRLSFLTLTTIAIYNAII